jgi:cytidylate kinase
MPVVTISGNLASGAREIGLHVARLLQIDFVDRELMIQAAQRCGVSVDTVAERDERYASFKERLSGILNTFLERSSASGADPISGATGLEAILSRTYADMAEGSEEPQLSDKLYIKTMTVIIQELAMRGDVVLLGRGSQLILDAVPGALHVLCLAPADLRAQRLAEREGIPVGEAAKRVAEGDRARAAFYRKFWKVDAEDPRLYDLTLETRRLPYEIAAGVVAAAAREKARAASRP